MQRRHTPIYETSSQEGINTAKLKLWRDVWAREKDKTRCANDLDTCFKLSNKKRVFQAAFVEGCLSCTPLSKEEVLQKIELNSQCTFTIGIPKEAISIICKLGNGAYGIVSKCQIKKIPFLPESIPCVCKEFKGATKSQLNNFGLEVSIDILHPGIVWPIAHTRSWPWLLICPFFNGGTLGDLLEIVPYSANFAKMMAIQDNKGKDQPPKQIKIVSPKE